MVVGVVVAAGVAEVVVEVEEEGAARMVGLGCQVSRAGAGLEGVVAMAAVAVVPLYLPPRLCLPHPR